MNLEELRKIIGEYKNKIIINHPQPGQLANNKLLFKEINDKYNNLFKNVSEMVYLAKNYNNLENLHIFCYCGNKNTFGSIKSGYHKYCSVKCSTNDEKVILLKKEKSKQTCLKKYGVEYSFQSENNKEKSKQTCLKKYGVEYSLQDKNLRNRIKQAYLKKHGVDHNLKNKEVIEKIKQSKLNNIDKNGLNSYQRGIIKQKQSKLNNIDKNGLNSYQRQVIKCRQTRLNNIDKNGLNSYQRAALKQKQTKLNDVDENGLNNYQRAIIKGKQTRLKRYDDENYNNKEKSKQTRLNNIDENGLNSYQRINIKYKQIMSKKYGVNHYFKSQEFKDKFKNKEWLFKVKRKEYLTKKKNNSFNTSKDEEQVYNYLLQKFNKDDIERQYRSEEYPFNCDFYIRSLDLYIEYHGAWTHGKKPFKNSIEDLEKLKELRKKSQEINFNGKKKDYYNNVIYTWTNLDVRKLNTFKKNKLNYKIFYNIEQFLSWFIK